MKKICVFLGSAKGNNDIYVNAAKELGRWIAKYSYTLVYGGSSVGLMGILADAVLQNNGKVEGFACKDFEAVLHPGLTNVKIFNNMAERKIAEIEYSDAFIAFPGGLGTLDELFEVWTLAKAKLLNKPICILNINNLFTSFYQGLGKFVEAGFITAEQFNQVIIVDNLNDLTHKLFPPISLATQFFSEVSERETTAPTLY